MGDESFKTSSIMEIFHLILKYIHYPELDVKIQEIYDLIGSLPDEDQAKEYLKIIVKYVLIVGPLSTDRVIQYTKRFPGGEEMAGTAAQEIREELLKTEKPYWELQGEIKNAQQYILENLTERFDVVGSSLSDKIRSIQSLETLNALFRKTNRVNSLEEFRELVDKALKS